MTTPRLSGKKFHSVLNPLNHNPTSLDSPGHVAIALPLSTHAQCTVLATALFDLIFVLGFEANPDGWACYLPRADARPVRVQRVGLGFTTNGSELAPGGHRTPSRRLETAGSPTRRRRAPPGARRRGFDWPLLEAVRRPRLGAAMGEGASMAATHRLSWSKERMSVTSCRLLNVDRSLNCALESGSRNLPARVGLVVSQVSSPRSCASLTLAMTSSDRSNVSSALSTCAM